MQLDSTTLAAVALLVAMAVATTAVGVYLIFTNPPKDRSKFVGVGAEKLTDAELAELERKKSEDENGKE